VRSCTSAIFPYRILNISDSGASVFYIFVQLVDDVRPALMILTLEPSALIVNFTYILDAYEIF